MALFMYINWLIKLRHELAVKGQVNAAPSLLACNQSVSLGQERITYKSHN